MFRFAAGTHGWRMRVMEHRPVACVPSPENIRDSPLPPNQRVTNPAGRTDWKSMFRLRRLTAASI
jgi:hypothetical protein